MKEILNQIEKDAEEYRNKKYLREFWDEYQIQDFKAGAISHNKWLIETITQQVEAYPMLPNEKKMWLEYLSSIKITDK